MRRAMLLLLMATASGCVGLHSPQARAEAAGVALYEFEETPPSGCREGPILEAKDGNGSPGEYQRALFLLRRAAAREGANAVQVIEVTEHVGIHRKNGPVTVRGRALTCVGAVLPNLRLNPPLGPSRHLHKAASAAPVSRAG
jgi:hypothetical protein